MATAAKHTCHRCVVHDVQGPFRQQGAEDAPELESLETTFSDGGEEIFFTSGYSAREIAQRHAREHSGQIYVNNISKKIKRRDLIVPVAYAVAATPVYTLRAPDEWHPQVYRSYWPAL